MIRDGARIEAFPLVLDFDNYPFGIDVVTQTDHCVRVPAVAVLDGIDESFFQRELDAKFAIRMEARTGDGVEDLLLHVTGGKKIGGK